MRRRRLKFAIIGSRGYPSTYGGFETFVRRLAPHLQEAGADVTVYGRTARIVPSAECINGVTVVHTPGLDRPTTSTVTFGLTSILHAAFRGFDAVLVLNVANGFWLPILRLAGIPTVVNVDGIEWERDKWSRFGRWVFWLGARLTAKFADEVVVDSRAIGDYWRRHLGVSSRFIPYGADLTPALPSHLLASHGIAPGSYILVVARLVPENNVELFLDSLEAMEPEVPAVVVGSAVQASGIEDRLRMLEETRGSFTWLGHVSDQDLLAQLWQHCAIYVHGHSVGGTNPALLQALAAGSPTIALDTVYNKEVLGPDWPTFPAGSPQELAELLTTLLERPEARKELSERGRDIVATRYAWSDVLQCYTTALLDATRRRQP